jgi:ATP-binding protein involved in chromosome partitioning
VITPAAAKAHYQEDKSDYYRYHNEIRWIVGHSGRGNWRRHLAGDVGTAPILAVASGKGGVGKTTVAVNLALALSAAGRRVGLVDADLYGPDVPRMMGLRRQAAAASVTLYAASGTRGARLEAVDRYGVQLASAGFLIGENQALGLHADLAQAIVSRLITQTAWARDTDCLVVDLPPGTADIQQLVFGQPGRKVIVVVVVTPQVVAHQDVRRLIADLGRRRAVTVGGIENMAGFTCPCCGTTTPLFPAAPDGDSIWAQVSKLARIPFSPKAAADADEGRPVMLTRGVTEQVAAYESAAAQLQGFLDAGEAPA